MRALIVSPEAGREFQHIIRHSLDRFGPSAAERYLDLLVRAYEDLRRNPERPGVTPASDGRWLYHLRHSRSRAPAGGRVRRPRHVLLFRHDPQTVTVLRILYDAMDLPRHLADCP